MGTHLKSNKGATAVARRAGSALLAAMLAWCLAWPEAALAHAAGSVGAGGPASEAPAEEGDRTAVSDCGNAPDPDSDGPTEAGSEGEGEGCGEAQGIADPVHPQLPIEAEGGFGGASEAAADALAAPVGSGAVSVSFGSPSWDGPAPGPVTVVAESVTDGKAFEAVVRDGTPASLELPAGAYELSWGPAAVQGAGELMPSAEIGGSRTESPAAIEVGQGATVSVELAFEPFGAQYGARALSARSGETMIFYKKDVRNPVNWGGYANFAADGTPAWCATPGLKDADEGGTTFSYAGAGGRSWDYLVANGYPNTTIEGYGLSTAEAIGATHGAAWLLGSNGDYAPSGMSSAGQAAAYALYSAAASYGGGDPSIDGCSTMWTGPSGYQTLVTRQQNGDLEIAKSSSNPDITDGNPCYSLEGAVFGVYSSDGTHMGDLTTDSNGRAFMRDIPAGEYYVVEVKAPEGYSVSAGEHWVVVPSGGTGTAEISDKPVNDPVDALLHKYDPITGGTAQGGATLAGAEFTVKYYAGYFADGVDPATLGASPTRTWVMATNERGYCRFSESFIVSGDEFYLTPSGYPTFPLGTVTVQETKAPEGYLLSTPELPNKVFVQRITEDGAVGDVVDQWNEHEFLDQVKASELWITKVGTKVGDDVAGGGSAEAVPLAGVEFSVYGSADYDDNGDGTYTVHPGAVAEAVITTDENGFAKTEYLDRPDGQHGALVYDTYLVVETGPAEDYDPIDPFIFVADTDGKTYYFMANDKFVNAGVEIVKVDSESGLPVLEAGAVFRVLDEHKNPIIWEQTYPEHVTFTDLVTGEDGTVLLPEKLNAGTYYLHEVSAPGDYLLGTEDVMFTVDATTDWDEPLSVEYPDEVAKGTIELIKTETDPGTGEDTGRPVEGAVYGIYASEDIVTKDGVLHHSAGDLVGKMETDGEGRAVSGELYLGAYVVRELESPDGWAVNGEAYDVALSYEDQHTAIVTAQIGALDAPTTLFMEKKGEQPDGSLVPLEETEWRVWAEDSGGATVFDVTAVTDGNGSFTIDHLPHGDGYTYHCQEIRTGDDYILDPEVYSFEVDPDGLIEGEPAYTIENTNYRKREITAHKQDSETGGPVSDTVFLLEKWTGGGKPVEAGGEDGEGEWVEVARLESDASGDALFEGLSFGWYHLVELYQNPDYMAPAESGFAGEFWIECSASSGVNQVQVVEDAPLTVEATVDKSTISQTSIGLVYTDEDGSTVSNVGNEQYRYDVGFSSGATNVFADEYWVVDECQMVESPFDLRIETIVTPAVKGDTDGIVHVLYRTNMTDPDAGSASGMNFAQPELHGDLTLCDGTQRFDPSGWDYLGAFDAGSRTAVAASSFLEEGEYVTGLALCYGAVEVGFGSVEPMSYMVEATHELPIETVIPNAVTSHITRNWSQVRHTAAGDVPKDPSGPHDDDRDVVSTTVLETFDLDLDDEMGEWESGSWNRSPSALWLARTGDSGSGIAFAAAATALLAFASALAARRMARRAKPGRRP